MRANELHDVFVSLPQFGSTFIVTLDPSKVTAQPLTFSNVRVFVRGAHRDSFALGPQTTPFSLLYIGGKGFVLPSCGSGCLYVAVQILSKDGKPFTFTLLDGETFTAWAVSATAFITPQAGQLFIKPGQTVNIVLRRDVLRK